MMRGMGEYMNMTRQLGEEEARERCGSEHSALAGL